VVVSGRVLNLADYKPQGRRRPGIAQPAPASRVSDVSRVYSKSSVAEVWTWLFALLLTPALVTNSIASSHSDESAKTPSDDRGPIPEIVVTAPPSALAAPFEFTQSISLRTREDLDRLQPRDLFAVVADVPGVAVAGGPRLGGKSFNIRGFGNTEDVSVELDSVPRDFEKYRFGSGVFLEPELLTSVEVWRQPAVRATPGSIGGSVRAWSRKPRDFLTEGSAVGGQFRSAYSGNNNEQQYSGIVAFQPLDRIGVLVSGGLREGDDFELPDGTRLESSATSNRTALVKVNVEATDWLEFALAYVGFEDASQQPFDATAGQPGLFGTVQRDVDDDTWTINGRIQGGPSWINLGFSAGVSSTRVIDESQPGESLFANSTTGVVLDTYDFSSLAFRLENQFSVPVPLGELSVFAGLDGLDSRREVSRVTGNTAINAALYPGGFNAAQPPGEKRFFGAYGLAEWRGGPLTLRAGLRNTQYDITAIDGTAAQLSRFNEPSGIAFDQTTPEFGVVFDLPLNLSVFYNYVEAFRPPLIDEYFTAGAFSRCIPFFLGDLAPASGVCGALYVPEQATAQEWGLSFATPVDSAVDVALKLTWFNSTVDQTLESIAAVGGQITQNGREERDGFEAESDFSWGPFFGRITYSRVRGEQSGVDPDGPLVTPLVLPADRIVARAGLRLFNDNLEAGYQVTNQASRDVIVGGGPGNFVIGTQDAYDLHEAYVAWQPLELLQLRVIGENLTNEEYALNNGFGGGIGTLAPGRNLRAVVTLYF